MMSLLRIVVYAESETRWTAQAIECDLMASGHTRDAALDTLVKLVEVHVAFDGRRGTDPLSQFAPAPPPCWKRFATAAAAHEPLELTRSARPTDLRYLVATSIG